MNESVDFNLKIVFRSGRELNELGVTEVDDI